MQRTQRLAAVVVVAALGLGLSAVAAQGSKVEFGFSGYTVSCNAAFTGSNGSPVLLNPSVSGCTMTGLPATVTQSGASRLLITGTPSAGWYPGQYTIPSGVAMTISIFGGCTISIPGAQTIAHGVGGQVVRASNVTGGIEVDVSLNSLVYVPTGCPFSAGSFGVMRTVTPALVPGVTVP